MKEMREITITIPVEVIEDPTIEVRDFEPEDYNEEEYLGDTYLTLADFSCDYDLIHCVEKSTGKIIGDNNCNYNGVIPVTDDSHVSWRVEEFKGSPKYYLPEDYGLTLESVEIYLYCVNGINIVKLTFV